MNPGEQFMLRRFIRFYKSSGALNRAIENNVRFINPIL